MNALRNSQFSRRFTGLLLGLGISGAVLLGIPGNGVAQQRPSGIGAGPETVRVVRVIDADTYDLLVGGRVERVRLVGVDAPELSQPYGPQAADSVRRLLPVGQLVQLTRASGKPDLYGRTLGELRLMGSGQQAGPLVAVDSLLVVRGWAWAWEPGRTTPRLAAEQLRAQANGRGLWKCGTAEPVLPHVWRGFTSRIKRLYWGGCPW